MSILSLAVVFCICLFSTASKHLWNYGFPCASCMLQNIILDQLFLLCHFWLKHLLFIKTYFTLTPEAESRAHPFTLTAGANNKY